MKSKKISKEEVSKNYVAERKVILVPFLDAERYLVKINNQ
jgi:hypothetical protein